MKKTIAFLLTGSVLLSVGVFCPQGSWSAELNGFTIDTQDKTVTVTLLMDQKVPYVLERQGRQMTIVLSGAQLSQEQLNNGLPVVIDNKNRFIGRAVPAEDGKIKIILPNLPASEYTVSVVQKRPAPSNGIGAPIPSQAVAHAGLAFEQTASADNFEQVASRFSSTNTSNYEPTQHKSRASRHRPVRFGGERTSGRSMLWNPYVVAKDEHPVEAPAIKASTRAPHRASEPANALVALADAPSSRLKKSLGHGDPDGSGLDNLHALSPSLPTGLIRTTDVSAAPDIQEPKAATEKAPAEAATDSKASDSGKPAAPESRAETGGFPWLWVILAIFIGGLGILGVIGALLLLRWMIATGRWPLQMPAAGPQLHTPAEHASAPPTSPPSGTTYADIPRDAFLNPVFQDRAAIRSQDYLKDMPDSIEQAVRNAVPQTFISRKKPRTASIRTIPRQTGNGTP